jgi:hypothetical protein
MATTTVKEIMTSVVEVLGMGDTHLPVVDGDAS